MGSKSPLNKGLNKGKHDAKVLNETAVVMDAFEHVEPLTRPF